MLKKRPFEFPGEKAIRVICDTDAYNECDDQFCVAHLWMTPRFDVKAMIAATGIGIPGLLAFIAFNMTTIPCFAAVGTAKAELQDNRRYKWTLFFWVATSYIVGAMLYTIGSAWWTAFIWAAVIAAAAVIIVMRNKNLAAKENRTLA